MSEENTNIETGVQPDPAPVDNTENASQLVQTQNEPKPEEPKTDKENRTEREDYSLDDDENENAGSGDDEDSKEEPDAFEVEWPEGYEADEELTGLVNATARECGVTDKAVGAYTARMLEHLQEKHAAMQDADDAALKQEWGRNFLANKKEAREFMSRIRKETGLTKEDMRDFAGARGFKVMYALSQKLNGGKIEGLDRKPNTAELDWAKAALTDKAHPDHKALNDARDPRHREVTARYFRAQGANLK